MTTTGTEQHMPPLADVYLQRIHTLLHGGKRAIIGLVGSPGAGKSTAALALQSSFGNVAQVVPMDGFHLANVQLAHLKLSHVKGAPDTFDSAGYVALLQRLRQQRTDEIIYAPAFERSLEEPIAGAIAVLPQTRLIVTEGNYLLLQTGHWKHVKSLLDEAWYVDVDEHLRMDRLIARHVQFGRTPEAAHAWVQRSDEPNARLIATTKPLADVLLPWQ